MDSIASAVVSSQVNKITKDIGDVVGLNEDNKGESQATVEYLNAEAKARREREAAKRKKEREERHHEKEGERDKIRDKYSLPPRGAQSHSQQHSKKEASKEDSKCVIS